MPERIIGCCHRWLCLRHLDSFVLIVVLGLQMAAMNYFMIHFDKTNSINPYLWFIGDGLVILSFIVAIVISYRFVLDKLNAHLHDLNVRIEQVDIPQIRVPMYGVLPCAYLSWFAYAALLIAKVVYIFQSDIPDLLPVKGDYYTSSTLKIIISMSVVVFILLINTQHDAEPNSDRNNYIADLCKGTAFDLFDSIVFLSYLFFNESKLKQSDMYSVGLGNTILALTCLNFILPGVALYKLSMTEFGEIKAPVSLSLIIKSLKLFAINFPYMVIRSYLWPIDDHVAVFLVKNVLYVVICLRYMIPEYVTACRNIAGSSKNLSAIKPIELNTTT